MTYSALLLAEFISKSNQAETVEELFGQYRSTMEKMGFDRLIFSLMTDHEAIQRKAGHGIIVNYSDDWMNYYAENNYEFYDPVRREMYSASTAFIWENVTRKPTLTDAQTTLMHEANEAGMKDGLGIPLRGPRGAIAGVGAASSSGGIELADPNLISYVNLISQQFYTVYLQIETRNLEPQDKFVYLTDREQLILNWCARGLTRADISDKLKLSNSAIDFHLKNALKKLDSPNITLGVLKALNKGLIQL